MGATRLSITALVVLALAACGGDDGDRKRAEAAAWCKVTLRLDNYWDNAEAYSDQMSYESAAEWVDTAPEDIRSATHRAGSILRSLATGPRPPQLAEARKEIGAYAAEYCPRPARCIADVERNPNFPCIND